jgi:CheY-like chemotaxis protein
VSAPRVLIVDDNPLNVVLARAVLGADAFEVESATDAQEAVQMVGTFRPALILMDIQLPGVDGLELTRQLKAEASTAHIVVVAFTAFAMRGDEARMRAAGCDGYISKPIDVGTFARQIRSLLPSSPTGAADSPGLAHPLPR